VSDAAQPSTQPARDSWALVARRIRVPLGFVFTVVYVWLARPTRMSIFAGGLLVLPGLLLRGLASGHVKKNEQLTTSGPYAYTRNPLYLGSLLLAAGFSIAARSWWIVGLALLMFAVIYVPVIMDEERFLRATFPEFEGYTRHVPRLFPRLTPHGSQPGGFSSELYWKHREYQALLGSIAVLAILIVKLIAKLVW
jgi:protein-S-isoprenylcysteine O-methyltransferase Ste14